MPSAILFVDDLKDVNEPLIQFIRAAYGLDGITADPANPAASARALWSADPPPAAAVVDLSLPDPARGVKESAAVGWELIRWMRRERPDAPVAVLTRWADQNDDAEALALGVPIFRRDADSSLMDPFWRQIAALGQPADPPRDAAADRQARLDQDYEWAMTDPQVGRAYGGQVVAVYRRQVFGAGRDHLAALRSARRRPDCPAREELAFAVTPYATADRDPDLAPRFRDPKLQEQYGGLVAAVHDGAILAAGNDREGAWRAAQRRPDCPSPHQVRYVLIPAVGPDSQPV